MSSYQSNCQYCAQTLEGGSATEAILRVEEHERDCPKNKHRLLIEGQITGGQITADKIMVVSPLSAPSFCVTASDAREIVRITPEGEVIVNPDFTTAEAAHAFWEEVQKLAAAHRAGQPQ